MSIANNIRRYREALSLSQPQLAQRAGVSQQLISQIERGENTTTKKLPQIARALEVPMTLLDPSFSDIPTETNYRGLSEGDASLWVAQAKPDSASTLDQHDLLVAMTPNIETRQFYRCERARPSVGLLPADIIIADAKTPPVIGDLVIANLADPETATSVTLIRRFYPPWLVPSAEDDPKSVVSIDSANIVAKVVAVFRPTNRD